MLFGIQEPISSAIWHALNNYYLQDAIFLAERLHAEVRSHQTAHLLATCYYRDGQKKHARHILKQTGLTAPKCKLLYARCCFDLSEYVKVTVLKDNNEIDENSFYSEYQSDTGVALSLLGESFLRRNLFKEAEFYFKKSLEYNPYLWSSFKSLCDLGVLIDPKEYFVAENAPIFYSEAPFMAISNHESASNSQVLSPLNSNDNDLAYNMCNPPTDLIDDHTSNRVCMKLFVNNNRENEHKQVKRAVCRNLLGTESNSTSTPLFGIFPMITSPVLVEDNPRPNNLAILTKKLNDFSIFSAYITPSPQPLPDDVFRSINQAPKATESRKLISLTKLTRLASNDDDSLTVPYCTLFSKEDEVEDHTPYLFSNKSKLRKKEIKHPPPCNKEMEPKNKVQKHHLYTEEVAKRPVTRSLMKHSPLVESKPRQLSSTPDISSLTEVHFPCSVLTSKKGIRTSDRLKNIRNENYNSNFNNSGYNNSNINVLNIEKIALPSSILSNPTKHPLLASTSPTYSGSHEHSVMLDTNQAKEFNEVLQANIKSAIELLQKMAIAYRELFEFNCTRSMELFKELPPHHYKTPWVMVQIARAYFELTDYQLAVMVFEKVRNIDPHYTYYMDIYSTALWHLQRDIELSVLSGELVDSNPNAPESWCVKGNCMSIHKLHHAAIKHFQKAIQLSPRFVYALTLLGHEYLCTDDLVNAKSYFRQAVNINSRHYNAWYGLAMIALREENYKHAESHFNRAYEINPSSCIILSRLAKVQHLLKNTCEALNNLENARQLDPKNSVPQYYKASILLELNRPTEALQILEQLQKAVPREALVHFLMGKVYQKLDKKYEAKQKYSIALSIDPNNRECRDAQNSLHQPASLQDETTPPNGFNVFTEDLPESPIADENNL